MSDDALSKAVSISEAELLLSGFKEIRSQRAACARQQVIDFFSRWCSVYNSQRTLWVKTAARFNIFKVLGVESVESLHSRFLAFLLDPRARHDQGVYFLRSFLGLIGLNVFPPDSTLMSTRIYREWPAGELGRLDIAMYLPGGDIIAVENKVLASEQENQVARYQRWIYECKQGQVDRSFVVFLSPSGESPQTIDAGSKVPVKPLSYGQLAEWLKAIRARLPSGLREVVDMYGDVCCSIGGSDMNDEAVFKFLSKPENLSAALVLEPSIKAVRDKVFEVFWKNVESELCRRLDEKSYARWQVKLNGLVSGKNSWLGLVDRTDPTANRFAFLIADLGGRETGRRVYCGVSRGSAQGTPAALEESVREALERANITGEDDPWWVRFTFLDDYGIPIKNTEDDDSVIRLNTDNVDPERPLAVRTATLLWQLFETSRKDVEALNDNYLYK